MLLCQRRRLLASGTRLFQASCHICCSEGASFRSTTNFDGDLAFPACRAGEHGFRHSRSKARAWKEGTTGFVMGSRHSGAIVSDFGMCRSLTVIPSTDRVSSLQRDVLRRSFAGRRCQAAAMRWMRLFCSFCDSAPMVKASRTPVPRAYRMASAGRSRRSPWPKIFMPTMPFP